MILSLTYQARVFIITILVGLCMGFTYDCLRVFRIAIKHNKTWVSIEDIIFWITASVVAFFVILAETAGEVRFFTVLGNFLGMTLYFLIISPIYIRCATVIIDVIKRAIKLFLEIVLTPIVLIFKIFRKPIKKISEICLKRKNKLLHLFRFYARMYIRSNKIVKFRKMIGKEGVGSEEK